MSQKKKEMQHIIRRWKEETGESEIDMKKVADYAHKKGWPLPQPVSGIDRLAKEFSVAAREETKEDSETGRTYRVYHAFPDGSGQGMLWVDIDEAPRNAMQKSAVMRRDQVVGDMYQLYLDLEHWNRVNPDEDPIAVVTDVTDDINERLAVETSSV